VNAAERYAEALRQADIDALLATLAPDVRLRSPLTARFVFDGAEEVGELFGVIFGELGVTDVDVRLVAIERRDAAVFHRAVVGGVLTRWTRVLGAPLAAMTSSGDRLVPWLLRRRGA
jgi:hypothetical protein